MLTWADGKSYDQYQEDLLKQLLNEQYGFWAFEELKTADATQERMNNTA